MTRNSAGYVFLVLLLVGCGGGGGAVNGGTPTMTLLSPNGGEAWPEGSSQTVTWASTEFAGNVDIEYSTDGGLTWLPLASNTPDDGIEVVVIPALASTTVRVQVSAADADLSMTSEPADQSDGDLEIAPVIALTSPGGGESWLIGSTVAVTWDAGSLAGSVDIDISTDGGATWSALVANTTNDGTEDVVVPAMATHQARVRVGAADGDPSVALAPDDASDANFQIGGPPTDIMAGLPGAYLCSLAWGDYDNDGDLDLALGGMGQSGAVSRIYRNDAGTFVDLAASLPGVFGCSLAWGDYDKDGDVDLALAGEDDSGARITRIYQNDAGTFTDIGAGLIGIVYFALAWSDYDNDGDLDLALAGLDAAGMRVSRIYRNDAGVFSDLGAGLPGVISSSLAWGDYDNDGDMDLALAGNSSVGTISRIYRNDAGTFSDAGAGLPGASDGALAWADFDNDADLDLAVAGLDGTGTQITRIYRNDAGIFTDLGAGLPGVYLCSLAWGDYDADGAQDLAIAGLDSTGTRISRIYRNVSGVFTDIGAGLPGVRYPSLAWGDCDADGDLDLALAGEDNSGTRISRIYRNDGGFAPNTPPAAPASLVAFAGGGEVLLTWDPATDAQTPQEGLSYNLRIGTTPTGSDMYSTMSDLTGLRRIPALGSSLTDPFFGFGWAWLRLPPGTYFASVQAIDASMAGGPWCDPVPFAIP